MKRLVIIIVSCFALTSYAAVYESTSNGGSVNYSDTPSKNASKIAVPTVNTISSPKSAEPEQLPTEDPISTDAKPTKASEGENSGPQTYSTFTITSPKDGATFQNQPAIPVMMSVEPNMLGGDKIQLMLDGKPSGVPTATFYQELGLVERGTHSLSAVILNKADQPIKQSNTVTIYVHRASVINSPARK